MKLIFGCGYLGQRVADLWLAERQEVAAVTRSQQRAEQLRMRGMSPIVADLNEPGALTELPPAETVLFAVGYERTSSRSLYQVYVEGLRHVLEHLPSTVSRFIYISSTGVYGQSGGEWVDERSACQPVREGGRACLAAEQLLREHAGGQSIILRMAGLYGPGRIPRRNELLAGGELRVPTSGYLNLIHVEDAAAVVLAAERGVQPPALYVVSDGHPVRRDEYYAELARQLGAPPPRFGAPQPDSAAANRALSDKRVDNSLMRRELQVQLKYPSYRVGLAAELGRMKGEG